MCGKILYLCEILFIRRGENVDISTILIKITGVVILIFTIKNFIAHIKRESKEAKASASQSKGERFLNGILFYLFLAFITALSLGMIFNN